MAVTHGKAATPGNNSAGDRSDGDNKTMVPECLVMLPLPGVLPRGHDKGRPTGGVGLMTQGLGCVGQEDMEEERQGRRSGKRKARGSERRSVKGAGGGRAS